MKYCDRIMKLYMTFYKKLMVGAVCIVMTGALSCHGETFQQKLDAYFAKHSKEIQKSIQAWDNYNLHKPEYHITEQELKDVVLRLREKVIRYLCLSLKHQIRFFWYYTQHMYACKKTAELRKKFDVEQSKEYALRDLDDMMKQFELRGILCPRLVECRKICASYVPNPAGSPDVLKEKLSSLIFTGSENVIAGGRNYWEHTVNDIYEIERVDDFFQYVLDSESDLYKGFSPIGIKCLFGGGFSTYTKWNPTAYPGWDTKNCPVLAAEHLCLPIIPFRLHWEENGELSSDGNNDIFKLKSYPKYCFDVSTGRYNHINTHCF